MARVRFHSCRSLPLARSLAVAAALAAPGLRALPQATPEAELIGRVTGRDGRPAADVRVHVLEQIDPALLAIDPTGGFAPRGFAGRTSARGVFRIDVPNGSLYRIWAEDGDGAITPVASAVRPGVPLTLRLMPAARVRVEAAGPGAERSEDSAPAIDWFLLARDRDTQEEFFLRRGTLAAGRGELPPLAPGHYQLRVSTRSAASAQQAVVVAPGESTTVRLALQPAATLHVDGAAEPGTSVALPFPFSGRHELRASPRVPLPALSLVLPLRFETPDGLAWTRSVGPLHPGEQVRVALDPPAGRSVTVKCPNARPGARVVLLFEQGGRREQRSVEPGDKTVVAGLPATDVLALLFDGAGGRAACRIAPDASEATLVAREAASVTIDVRGHEGPPRDAKVFLFPRTLPEAAGIESLFPTLLRYPDRAGHYHFAALFGGEYELRAEASWHVPEQLRVTLEPGEHLRETVRLEHGYRVHGRVLAPDGKPVPGLVVQMDHPLAGARTAPIVTTTDARGAFSFEGVPEGVHLIEARRSIGTRTELARTRAAAGPQPIELKLADEDPRLGH